jgi:hypothetical protein
VRQQRGITDIFCVCKKKKTGPANVFDYPQGVSFLFTFCPPAYLADLSNPLQISMGMGVNTHILKNVV